ncbi:MAG: RrF2 family transcriptional regulator [Christensenellales bacterium]|jgi:Rrf2 family protein
MRISTKGRYAVAAMVYMAKEYANNEYIAASTIADKLGISKIYLEQVFSLLKRGGLVNSIKGSQGGYLLVREPRRINVYDVLYAVESSLFEKTEPTAAVKAPEVDDVMRRMVFDALDEKIGGLLLGITIADLAAEVQRHQDSQSPMYYI